MGHITVLHELAHALVSMTRARQGMRLVHASLILVCAWAWKPGLPHYMHSIQLCMSSVIYFSWQGHVPVPNRKSYAGHTTLDATLPQRYPSQLKKLTPHNWQIISPTIQATIANINNSIAVLMVISYLNKPARQQVNKIIYTPYTPLSSLAPSIPTHISP